MSRLASPQRLSRCLAAVVLLGGVLGGCASTTAPGPAHEIRGSGRPVVVLASGYGMPRETWQPVTDALSPDFTVFSLDRPGYGGQPDTDRPRDPCTQATDLRQALQAAGLQPPYLLVGHSIGGLYQYAFARLYPQDVSGLVLLDPTHPRNWDMLQTQHPLLATSVRAMMLLQRSQALRQEFWQQTQCLDTVANTAALKVPTRLLVSRRYSAADEDIAPDLQTLQADWTTLLGLPSATLLWDSGHHIQQERPDAVRQAVSAVAGRPPPAHQAPLRVAVGARGDQPVDIGTTRQPDVWQLLGPPDETRTDGPRTIWLYRAPGLRVPQALTVLPVIGDLADLLTLAQGAVERHETIVTFDAQGVVQQARRRRVED